jgi:hypothetical protein
MLKILKSFMCWFYIAVSFITLIPVELQLVKNVGKIERLAAYSSRQLKFIDKNINHHRKQTNKYRLLVNLRP